MKLYFEVLKKERTNRKIRWRNYFCLSPHLTRYLGTYSYQFGERQYSRILDEVKDLNIKIIDIKKIFLIKLKIQKVFIILEYQDIQASTVMN